LPREEYAIFTLRIQPGGLSIVLKGPSELVQAALMADVLLEQPCAGDGTCGRCRVRFADGAPDPSAADCECFTADQLLAGWRLACQATVSSDAAIEIPAVTPSPGVKSFGDQILAAPDRVPLAAAFAGEGGAWAVAIDVGTTTLAAALVHLRNGRVGAADTALNPQTGVGPDVMSRINYAGRSVGNRKALTAAVRRGLAGLVSGLCRSLEIGPSGVVAAAVVGNPAMLHLWRGVDPASLGQAPYLGQWVDSMECLGAEVELPIDAAAEVYVLPAIRSHVGADAVAAALAIGLDIADGPTLLLDLGTNSEILLGDAGGVVASSTAAGPAFEGGAVSCGMRAAVGAIDACHIEPDGRVLVHVIGGVEPTGICGAGLLDAVAELRRAGVIDPGGRMARPDDRRHGLPGHLADRMAVTDRGTCFRLAVDAQGQDAVTITAADVRQVQLAVGAIRAGIDLLCAEAGLAPSRFTRVCVAGTFGQSVRLRSLFRLGMLPDIDAQRVHVVGNAAGAGARLALIDARTRDRAVAFARRVRYVELAGRADYAEAFAQRLRFPDSTRW
jgi:uncharacterized 2Fe-2S/4Fe-4S cluster protein (DUF4445 family)